MLRKKGSKRKKRKQNSSKLQGKVYMPQKKSSSTRIQKRRRFSIFKKSSRNITKRKLSRRKKVLSKVSRLFFYILLPLIFIALLYISTLFIINMRNGENTEEKEREYVIGIEEIPTYPDSQFIFQNSINEPSVANFIGSGNSAYRLPLNKTVTQAYEYYLTLLPELGWEHVLSVEVGSEEMKQGEYWIKDNTGLRIYSKFNDLWYELITVEQANNGLRERVEREIERDLLLASDELQELLPDFPWAIEIPKEYIISYRTSNYDDLRTVEFRKIGTDETVTVTPVGPVGGPLDNHLREYVDYLNEQEEETKTWGITNTILAYTLYGTALQGTISFNGQPHQIAVVSNTYNNVVYVIHSNEAENSFFEYVFSNLLPANMNRD
jgi:hypothetical protein